MKKFDVTILTASVLVLGLVVLGVSQAKEPAGEATGAVVATIDGKNITQTQLYNEMKPTVGKEAMASIIATELINLEGKAQGITISDEELNKVIGPVKEKLKTPEKFQEYLKEKGMDEKAFLERTRLLLLRDKLIEKAYPTTEKDITDYYEKYKDKLNGTLEQVRPEVEEKAKEKNRRKNTPEWMDAMSKKYKVKVLDPALDSVEEANK